MHQSVIRCAILGAGFALTACRASETFAPATASGACTPAPITNTRDPRVSQILVLFKPDVNGSAAIARLQEQLNFAVIWEPSDYSGFYASLTSAQISSVQCDPAVASLEWDVVGSISSPAN